MRRSRLSWAVLLAVAVVTLGGCAASGGPTGTASADPGATSSTPQESSMASPTPVPPTVPASPTPSESVSPAVLDLPGVRDAVSAEAARRGVTDAEVTVVSYDQVTWPDGSLGCPQPSVTYTQALVPGRLLVLAVGGQTARYHASDVGDFAYCATPSEPLGDATR